MLLEKYKNNPILCANPECEWESLCVLNPAVIYDGKSDEFIGLATGNFKELVDAVYEGRL